MITTVVQLTCSCGWSHQATTRPSATLWKKWHRLEHTPKGSRLSESGHVVTIVTVTIEKDRTTL